MAKTPFKKDFFDFINAVEVLQHTDSPLNTLKHLVSLLKTGGYLTFSLYMDPPNILGKVKIKIMNTVRIMLNIFGKKAMLKFTKLAPVMIKNKFTYPLARFIFLRPDSDDDHIIWHVNHDNYINGNQKTYSRTETLSMIEESGLEIVKESSILKNHFLTRKKIVIFL